MRQSNTTLVFGIANELITTQKKAITRIFPKSILLDFYLLYTYNK